MYPRGFFLPRGHLRGFHKVVVTVANPGDKNTNPLPNYSPRHVKHRRRYQHVRKSIREIFSNPKHLLSNSGDIHKLSPGAWEAPRIISTVCSQLLFPFLINTEVFFNSPGQSLQLSRATVPPRLLLFLLPLPPSSTGYLKIPKHLAFPGSPKLLDPTFLRQPKEDGKHSNTISILKCARAFAILILKAF